MRAASTAAADLNGASADTFHCVRENRTGADDVTAARVSSNRVIQLTARSIRPTWSDGPRRALFRRRHMGRLEPAAKLPQSNGLFL